jgi:glycosyltransferase involved in cell wall biosynthesis
MLSVIIPCFNDGAFLSEAIDSVFAQESGTGVPLPDLEVLVVDDQSTDAATLELLERLPDRWPKVRVLRNTRIKGLSGARNVGIEASCGEWIAFLDADDIWLPDALASRWNYIREYPEVMWLAGDFDYWYPDGVTKLSGNDDKANARGRILAAAYESGQPLRLARPVREFIEVCLILVCGVMVRRELFEVVGGFDHSLSPAEDYEMWLRLSRVTDLHFLPKRFFHYRQRPESITNRDRTPMEKEVQVFERMLKNPDFADHAESIREKLCYSQLTNAIYFRTRHRWPEAVRAAAASVRWRPAEPKGWKQLAAALLKR